MTPGMRIRLLIGLAAAATGLATAGAADLRSLWSRPNGQIVPLTAFAGKGEDRFFGDTVFFIHTGPGERVAYTWELPQAESGPPFGLIRCQVDGGEGSEEAPQTIPVALDANLEWDGDVGRSRSQWQPAGAGKHRMTRAFEIGKEIATLSITGQLVGKSLVLEIICDKPLVKRCTPGDWGTPEYKPVPRPKPPEPKEGDKKPEAEPAGPPRILPPPKEPPVPATGKFLRRINVPFLDHEVRAFPEEKVFATSLSDWRISNEATEGEYPALSDGSRNKLVARFIYTASQDVRQVLPNIPHEPSPSREDLGKRIWFEVAQDNPFAKAYEYLEKLTKRGMRDYTLVLPTWQNKGPEEGLPAHFPAKGKEEEWESLELLGKTCEKLGIRFALQEEYSDMYPEFDDGYDLPAKKFSSKVSKYLCLSAEGVPVEGYKNRRTEAQAALIKPAAVLKFAEDEGKKINRGYETSAAFLHRHASNPPGRSIDYTASEAGAGMAKHNFDATCRLFAQQRKVHGGPVLGTGGSHWIYAGFLDGASAQPGAGWKAREGQSMPLLVDFDLLRIHPLQVTCGMGDLASWQQAPEAGGLLPWGQGTPMWVLDQYRMQQVIFGHGSMLGGTIHGDEGLHWIENHLVLPVARQYTVSNPIEISYRVNGSWVDASAALLAEDLTVVRVLYENGLEITANGSEDIVDSDGVSLPQFGWVARQGDSLLAYTGMADGATVDYAKSAEEIFVNARRFEDWEKMQHFDGFKTDRGTNDAWRAKNLNAGGEAIDFGGIKTNGSVHLRKEGSDWVLAAYPVDGTFDVMFKADVYRAPFEVASAEGSEGSVKPESVEGGSWWRLPLNGAVDYRFPAGR